MTHLRHLCEKPGAHSRHDAAERARAIGPFAASSRTPEHFTADDHHPSRLGRPNMISYLRSEAPL
jgi:hypothetical protein